MNKVRSFKLFIMILSLIVGTWLLYVGYLNHSVKEPVKGYQLNNTSVTIIDLKNKDSTFNTQLVVGFALTALGLMLIIDTFLLKKNTQSAPIPAPTLTEQEKVVVSYMKQGMTNKEIAHELSISLSTVKSHINNIYKKMKVRSRTELLKLS